MKKRPFRFGVTAIEGAASREAWRTKARRIEDAGYATLVIPDHFTCQSSPIPALLRLCWQMTFLVEWCVTCACFPMSFDGTLPSQQTSQALSSIVGASPCGCPRGWVGCPRPGLQSACTRWISPTIR